MTAACRAMITHSFDAWQLNRITIECATDNTRSRAVAERLGFKLEGIVRQIEWLHDHFADHALYGRLRSEPAPGHRHIGNPDLEARPDARFDNSLEALKR
jgi:ribosomal-protein-serine acetyltransferase